MHCGAGECGRWTDKNIWQNSSKIIGGTCAPWLIGCSARRLRLRTQYRKRGIVEAELIADPERLRRLDLSVLDEAE